MTLTESTAARPAFLAARTLGVIPALIEPLQHRLDLITLDFQLSFLYRTTHATTLFQLRAHLPESGGSQRQASNQGNRLAPAPFARPADPDPAITQQLAVLRTAAGIL